MFKASVTGCNFPCKLFCNVGKDIHCKLQKTCYVLHSQATTCNGLTKDSMQSLQKLEWSNCCKPKKVVRQVAKRACYTLQLTCSFSRCAILIQVVMKIAACNTSFRARFCFLQRLQRSFETIASYSPRLQPVTCLLQLVMDFFQRCETSWKKNCIV